MSKEYSDLLKDPRWQKTRLKVMERDGFVCCHCYSKDKTLNVHHLIYVKNKEPWDYHPDFLITLCEDCHDKLTKNTNEMIDTIRKLGNDKVTFYAFCDIFKAMNDMIRNIQG